MRSNLLFIWFSALTLLTSVTSGQMLMSGPVEGYVFDEPSRSFRAVLGFPGSASLGPALSVGFDYGSVAPLKNYAIAFQKNHIKFVSGLGTGHISISSIPAVFVKAESVAWSGDGSAAVIYSRSGNWVQLLTGFPATASGCSPYSCVPAVVESVDVAAMHASLATVVLDVHGKNVALGASGERAGVYLNTDRHGFALVAQASLPTALSFSDDGTMLYALDEPSSELSAVRLSNFSFQTHSLTGLVDPFALKFGRDAAGRAVLYIASRKNRIFRTYDPANNHLVSDIALSFVPTGIDELGTRSFLLSPRTKASPLWLFSSAPHRGVYFVPAPLAGGNGQ
jgi:hypothetical protein